MKDVVKIILFIWFLGAIFFWLEKAHAAETTETKIIRLERSISDLRARVAWLEVSTVQN